MGIRQGNSARSALIVATAAAVTASVALGTTAMSASATSEAEPTIAAESTLVVRALGDSITAAYGHYGDGSAMKSRDLAACGTISYPGLNDRCSSNTDLGPGDSGPVTFLPDYGLANGIAWPAQVMEQLGLPAGSFDYANRAVTGADPKDLLPVDEATQSGQLRALLEQTVADNPDLTLMTIGANPLLGDFLAGPGTRCLLKKRDSKFLQCAKQVIAAEDVEGRVGQIIDDLLVAPNNTIVLSLYPTVLPATAVGPPERILTVLGLVNDEIRSAAEASAEWNSRVFVSTPPLFPYGLAPGKVTCPGHPEVGKVDGASVQSTITQEKFGQSSNDAFCPGPQRWIISADMGVHPTKEGHRQIASSVSDLITQEGLLP